MDQTMENMPELALEWHRAGRGAVLATVIETWGSAPRGAGSQMVVDGAGLGALRSSTCWVLLAREGGRRWITGESTASCTTAAAAPEVGVLACVREEGGVVG